MSEELDCGCTHPAALHRVPPDGGHPDVHIPDWACRVAGCGCGVWDPDAKPKPKERWVGLEVVLGRARWAERQREESASHRARRKG